MDRQFLVLTLLLTFTCPAVAQDVETDAIQLSVYRLQYVESERAALLISRLYGEDPSQRIASDASSNSLIVRATADLHDEISALLTKLDANTSNTDAVTTMYRIENVSAKSVAVVLGSLFGSEQDMRVGVDSTSNAIIVAASPEAHEKVALIVQEIDRPRDTKVVTGEDSIQFTVTWVADGEQAGVLPPDVARIFKEQGDKLGIENPTVRVEASVAVYLDGESTVSVQNGSDGAELSCSAIIEPIDESSYKLRIELAAEDEATTVIKTVVKTKLGHPVVLASTASAESNKPAVFVLAVSN